MLGGVTNTWEWDVSLFSGAAKYYDQGRLPYARGLADAISGILPPGERGRLLDVGCGPGTLSLRLAGIFSSAVGIDPDPEMIAEARLRASAAGDTAAEFIQARAEDLPMDLGIFEAAVFGQSFHWMDQDLVASAIRGMLTPDGLFIHVADRKDAPPWDRSGLADPAPPYDEIRDLVRKYLGPVRRAGRGVLPDGTKDGEKAVLARSGFAGPEKIIVPGGEVVPRSFDDVTAWVHSQSGSAPGLFGDDLAVFDADLHALLARAAPGGLFAEHVPDTEVRVWRRS
jgi:SAM-dependent methyltransferase